MHEKRLHRMSAFVTLTYDDKHLPELGSLRLRDLQLFMKRLRKVRPEGLRFFACGEYGDTTKRPHYHLLLFNTEFADQRFLKWSPNNDALYRSAELGQLWPSGDHYIGTVDSRSAAYVAGYVMKKVGSVVDYSPRENEFRVMSRRPGIGYEWYQRYKAEFYKHDSAILEAREVPLPRFYDDKFKSVDEAALKVLKRLRRQRARLHPEDRTKARMLTRENFELLKLARFSRDGAG